MCFAFFLYIYKKKNMKSLFFYALFLLLTINTYSQNESVFSHNSSPIEYANYHRLRDGEGTNKNIKGSPYLNEEFVLGNISPNNKKFLIRYNAYNDLFEVKKSKDSVLNLNKRNLNYTIQLGDLKFKSFMYSPTDNDSKRYGYFAIMTTLNDSVVLLKKFTKKFTKKQEASNSYTSDIPASFSSSASESYFLLIHKDKDKIIKIRLKAKDIYDSFPKKRNKIKTYIKSTKLKLKNESDLIKIINYINTLE